MAKPTENRWRVRAGTEETEAAYDPPETEARRGTYVLAHGAGGNMDAKNLLREAKILRGLGFGVVRFNFLYRAAGRKYPDKMPQLIACYAAVVESIGKNVVADLQIGRHGDRSATGASKDAPLSSNSPRPLLFLGGHSMGGRVATMMAAEGFACDGLILFSYPLHPPGKFDQLRAAHLPRIQVPVLCFNGTRDDFMRRDLMEQVLAGLKPAAPNAGWTHHWLDGADHSLAVRKKDLRSNADVESEIGATLEDWLTKL